MIVIHTHRSIDPDLLPELRGMGIEYTGDMANLPGRGAIVAAHGDRWGQHVDIVLEDGRRIDKYPLHLVGTPAMRDGCAVQVILTGPQHGAPYLAEIEAAAILLDANRKAAAQVTAERFEQAEAAREIANAPLFYWNGIKDTRGGRLQRCSYSDGRLLRHPEGTITIYARDYARFSPMVCAAFCVENKSDSMTDYFEQDHIRVIPAHPLYGQVRAAMQAQEEHQRRRQERRHRQ